MKILFDHQIFVNQRIGGISRYITDLNRGLNRVPGVKSGIAAALTANFYLDKTSSFPEFPLSKRIVRTYNKTLIRKFLIAKTDIIHPTYYNIRYLRNVQKPVVITVHDLIYFKYPQYFKDYKKHEAQFSDAINRCDGIICISQKTKKDLEHYFGQINKPLEVIHHGIALPANKNKTISKKKFFLYVGSRHLYKNFSVLLTAFMTFLQQYSEYKLLAVGGEPLNEKEKAAFDKHSQYIQHIPFVTDAELQGLYAEAAAMIITSFDEGFCYPAVEALLAGTRVICSDIEVLREVAGEHASYFDPNDADSLLQRMVSVADLDSTVETPVNSYFRQYYTIERMSDETRQFYDSIK